MTAPPARGNRGEEGQPAMTMTDPIADMLTRLRNANSAYHDTVAMPYSKIKAHIAEILQQEGYIAGWTRRGRRGRQEPRDGAEVRADPGALDRRPAPGLQARPAGLREEGQPASGPGRTGRRDHLDVRPACMTDKQAGKRGVGGEVLAYVW